ncbi:MAG: hypothetical protein R2831_13440 [Chitinophagaceae bacterium]
MLAGFVTRWRHGDPIVIVSGLPRSGTSMLMSMLQAGGLELLTDAARTADVDNPKGYFELERVKGLATDPDKSWLRAGRGKGLKVISHLLKYLPPGHRYQVILARRDLTEVIDSQDTMLRRSGEDNTLDDDQTRDLYRRHLVNARALLRGRRDMRALEVHYSGAIDDPKATAARINRFLGGKLDEAAMAASVDPTLYRNRSSNRSP